MKEQSKLLPQIITFITTIFAVIIGAVLNQFISDNSYNTKHNKESRIECYSKLESLSKILPEKIASYCEAKNESERYYFFYEEGKDKRFLELSVSVSERAMKLRNEASQSLDELLKTVSKLKIYFSKNDSLFSSIEVLKEIQINCNAYKYREAFNFILPKLLDEINQND